MPDTPPSAVVAAEPSAPSTASSGASGPTGAADGPVDGESGRAWSAPRWVVRCLAVATVLLLGADVWFGVLAHNRSAADDRRAAALQAARQVAADFSTYDYRTAKAQFEKLLAVSTGEMRKQVQESLDSLVPVLAQGKATAVGQVRDAAVVAARGNEVSVIAVVDERVTNTSIPNGAVRRYRFFIVMTHQHGTWLVSDLAPA